MFINFEADIISSVPIVAIETLALTCRNAVYVIRIPAFNLSMKPHIYTQATWWFGMFEALVDLGKQVI